MRFILVCLLAFFARTVCAEGIVAVLKRSQQQRLEAMPLAEADSPGARVVRDSFERVLYMLALPQAIELRVIRGETVAETLQGHVVVANESLADLPEGERLFILAHEFGHIALGHGPQMGLLFEKWVPGAVTPQQTDAVAAVLGREAALLAHRQEFEADAFGLRALRQMGYPRDDAFAAFMRLGSRSETATHPGTRRRMAALRAVDVETGVDSVALQLPTITAAMQPTD